MLSDRRASANDSNDQCSSGRVQRTQMFRDSSSFPARERRKEINWFVRVLNWIERREWKRLLLVEWQMNLVVFRTCPFPSLSWRWWRYPSKGIKRSFIRWNSPEPNSGREFWFFPSGFFSILLVLPGESIDLNAEVHLSPLRPFVQMRSWWTLIPHFGNRIETIYLT